MMFIFLWEDMTNVCVWAIFYCLNINDIKLDKDYKLCVLLN